MTRDACALSPRLLTMTGQVGHRAIVILFRPWGPFVRVSVSPFPEVSTAMENLARIDPEVAEAIRNETRRQGSQLELIASENFVSEAVLEALGTVLTNKYAEGYPGKRYYGGCEFVDVVETLAIERAKQIFGATTPTCSRTPAPRPTPPSTCRCCKPGRHHPGHEPLPRRPPHPRPPAQLLRPLLQGGRLRRAQGRRDDRLRGHGRPRRASTGRKLIVVGARAPTRASSTSWPCAAPRTTAGRW